VNIKYSVTQRVFIVENYTINKPHKKCYNKFRSWLPAISIPLRINKCP
jgi:hypothetical protein